MLNRYFRHASFFPFYLLFDLPLALILKRIIIFFEAGYIVQVTSHKLSFALFMFLNRVNGKGGV